MTLPIIQNVVARFKLADSIGDPSALIREFEVVLNNMASFEANLPRARVVENILKEAQRIAILPIQSRPPSTPEGDNAVRNAGREYAVHKSTFASAVKYSYPRFQRSGYALFFSLLQQYDLPPKIRKGVEAAAKYYSKSRINVNPKPWEVLDLFEKYMSLYREQFELATMALTQSKHRVEGEEGSSAKLIKAGPFTIVNTGGFDEKVVQTVSEVVEKAASLLQRKGLGKVCYGDILITNTLLKSTVLAFYMSDKDELFVRANLRKGHDVVRLVIHELGHRLHHKFLKSKDRDLQMLYYNLGRSEQDRVQDLINNPESHPKPGETMQSKGKTYEVVRTVYDKVHLVRQDDPKQIAAISLLSWIQIKSGLKTGLDLTPDSAFITGYAKTSYKENFAEMVAFYCLDQLPEAQVKMLEALL